MQTCVNLVDLIKSFQTSIYLQTLASIQPRTGLSKFAKNSQTLENKLEKTCSDRSGRESTVGRYDYLFAFTPEPNVPSFGLAEFNGRYMLQPRYTHATNHKSDRLLIAPGNSELS